MTDINAVYTINENLLALSNTLNDPIWTKVNVSVDAALQTRLLGPTADAAYSKIKEIPADPAAPANLRWHQLQKAQDFPLPAGTTCTITCMVKKAERSVVSLGFLTSTMWGIGNPYVFFDLNNGTKTNEFNVSSSSIELIADGWYRISVTQTITTGGITGANILLVDSGAISYTGILDYGLYLGDVQLTVTNQPVKFFPTFATFKPKVTTPSISRFIVTPEMFGAKGDYKYFKNNATNDTVAINAAINHINLLGGGEVRFDDSKSYYCDAILVKSNVHLNFGKAHIVKTNNSGTRYLASLLLADQITLVEGTYYNQYNNIKITGGFFDIDPSVTIGTNLIRLRFCTDLVIKDLTITGYIPSTWAMEIGGRRIRLEGITILGGARLFEDGIHIVHGQYIDIVNCHVQSGDDAIAMGRDTIPSDATTIEPDPIRYVNVTNCTVRSAMAVGIKIYAPADAAATGPNWEVTDINIANISGQSGLKRNGGITVFDNVVDTRRELIKRINISNVVFNVGSSTWGADSNNINPFALYILNVKDCSFTNIKFLITENPTIDSGGMLAFPLQVIRIDLGINIFINDLQISGVAPSGKGIEITRSENIRIRNYSYNKTGNSSLNSAEAIHLAAVVGFEITNSQILGIKGSDDIFNVPTRSYSTTTIKSINNKWSQISPSTGKVINFLTAGLTGLTLIDDDYSQTTKLFGAGIATIPNVRILDNIGIGNIGVGIGTEMINTVNSLTVIAATNLATAWLANTAVAAFTITLPPPADMFNSVTASGRRLLFKNTGGNNLTLSGAIDTSSSYIVGAYGSVVLLSDGVKWNVIG
jgi:hypothetical protein